MARFSFLLFVFSQLGKDILFFIFFSGTVQHPLIIYKAQLGDLCFKFPLCSLYLAEPFKYESVPADSAAPVVLITIKIELCHQERKFLFVFAIFFNLVAQHNMWDPSSWTRN